LLPTIALADRPLYPVLLNLNDKPSLQRGAKVYFNYCSGCHSLEYLRYNRLAKDIGIVDDKGQILHQLVTDNLIFNDAKVTDIIKTALPSDVAKREFGVVPPDLSVIARAKGGDWLFTYLKSFYRDDSRLWGTNNLLVANVAMPNVLNNLQGVQIPVFKKNHDPSATNLDIDHLVLIEKGQLSPVQFNQLLTDVVNFLVYVSEPSIYERKRLGKWVLLYLAILALLLFYLRKTEKPPSKDASAQQ